MADPALQVCTDAAALERTAPAWDELASSLASPMQQLAWLRAAPALAGLQLQVVALADGSAVAPLESRRGRLETATVSRLFEPVDLLWESEEALGRLCEELARLGSPLLLRRVPADSPSLRVLGHGVRPQGLRRRPPLTGPARAGARPPGGGPRRS